MGAAAAGNEDESPATLAQTVLEKSSSSPCFEMAGPGGLWRAALPRYSRALDLARARWRVMLRRLIQEKQQATNTTEPQASDSGMSKAQVAQLVQAARASGQLKFEISTASNGQHVVP